jgi:hypothetical protein
MNIPFLLELTLVRGSWTFNFDYVNYLLAGVIWYLGWCMVILLDAGVWQGGQHNESSCSGGNWRESERPGIARPFS